MNLVNKNFASDNVAGASPEIMDALVRINAGNQMPYGGDESTRDLENKLKEIFECDLKVFPVSTGTAANSLSLSLITPPWGQVMCHRDSHIANDECGAPEVFNPGSKLCLIGGNDSKIDLKELEGKVTHRKGDVHTSQAGCVSVTQVTETGSVYRLEELKAISNLCRQHGLSLHMDGARFANALVSLNCSPAEMTWKSGVDILSFGTAKNGTMNGEAVILFNPEKATELAFRRKRSGHLLSKMRYLSQQILTYLENDLWLENARHANDMAGRLEAGLRQIEGVELLGTRDANILFCKLPAEMRKRLQNEGFIFYSDAWGPDVVRLVTSFVTAPEAVEAFLETARSVLITK